MKYNVFESREAEAQGLVVLARVTRVDALPGRIYRVRAQDLSVLNDLELGYRIASNAEAQVAG